MIHYSQKKKYHHKIIYNDNHNEQIFVRLYYLIKKYYLFQQCSQEWNDVIHCWQLLLLLLTPPNIL
jgi:hypothetical protein